MKRTFILNILFVLFVSIAVAQGIQFKENLSWATIKKIAGNEGKYIFVDCFTTWCAPCKSMDNEVYPNEEVGQLINSRFIAVKVQMDTTKKDDSTIKNWYKQAGLFLKQYNISSFPTYLFFSPDGRIVHKGIGKMEPKEFMDLANAALSPDKSYYVLMDRYRRGKLEYSSMPPLAKMAFELDGDTTAFKVARTYMKGYLERQDDTVFLEKDKLEFISLFDGMITSQDKIFKYCLEQPNSIDSSRHIKGYAKGLVKYIVIKEEVQPQLTSAKRTGIEPDWGKINTKIQKLYGAPYADLAIVNGKLNWNQFKHNMPGVTKYLVQLMELEKNERAAIKDIGTMVNLNNSSFLVFQYSHKKDEMEAALTWAEEALQMGYELESKPSPGIMDTKANLLYKLGRKAEAIAIEEQVVSLLPNEKEFAETLQKMKAGTPTWPAKQ